MLQTSRFLGAAATEDETKGTYQNLILLQTANRCSPQGFLPLHSRHLHEKP